MKTALFTNNSDQRSASANRRRRSAGILLIECVFYAALFMVVIGMAFQTFYVCWDNSKNFRRNSDEIIAMLTAGERWRKDVRTATAPVRIENTRDGQMLRIPQGSGEIDYRFSGHTLWRRSNARAGWTQALAKLKSSRMAPDQRQQVSAWRWELELIARQAGTVMLPKFTFEAVSQPAY